MQSSAHPLNGETLHDKFSTKLNKECQKLQPWHILIANLYTKITNSTNAELPPATRISFWVVCNSSIKFGLIKRVDE